MSLRVRVRVAEKSRFEINRIGEYRVAESGSTVRYYPTDEATCRFIVDNIRIGINFHWQQEVSMVLPGVIEIEHHSDGTATLYNELPLDTYLTSVISSEMSPDAPEEFLKAHAIISRSWAMGKILHRHEESSDGKLMTNREIRTWEDTADHEGFDLCADDHCQRYQGIGRVNATVKKAVEDTAGIVLTDDAGEVIDARFSKCCGGKTEIFSTCWQDEDMNYLQAFDDPYCDPARHPSENLQKILETVLMKYDQATSDYYQWEETVSPKRIERILADRYNIVSGRVKNLKAELRGPSGRIKRLRIEAENGTFFIGKELAIRRLLSEQCLYSSAFEISRETSGMFRLNGHGWGHGVGLCQIGAAIMAYEGKTSEEILKFYYPNTKLTKL